MATESRRFEEPSLRPKIGSLAGANRAIQRQFALWRALRAAAKGRRAVVRVDGQDLAVIPLRDLRRLEWFLEQEKEEELFDRIDAEEADRILSDPAEVPIPFEQVRRELGLGGLPD